MSQYVEGFVIPVPKKSLAAYRTMAKLCSKIWMEYGALEYVECLGDNLKKGKLTSFPRSVKLKAGETVIFSWIVYRSKAQRDKVWSKVMKDPRMAMMNSKKMPFDGKRMIFGGFKPFIKI